MANEPTAAAKQGGANPPAHHIRTYAADVARLSGKPLPGKPAPSLVPTPAPAKTEPARPAPVPAPAKPAAPPPEPPPARIIPKAPSTDETREAVLERLKRRAEMPPAAAPLPDPGRIPAAPSTDEKEEEVLARLRARAAASAAAPTPVPPPASEAPPIPLTEKPAPSAERMPPPPSRAPAPAPAAPERIHTYTSDFADRVDAKDASTFSVLAAEADAGRAIDAVRFVEKPRIPTAVIAGIALLLLGAATIYFAFALLPKEEPVPVRLAVPSLIFADHYRELTGEGAALRAAFADMAAVPVEEGEASVAHMTRATTSPEGVTTFIPEGGGALVAALMLPAPDVFLRSVMPETTLGALRAGGETRPFFLFRVDSYERAFAGMLAWEARVEADLADFYPPFPEPPPPPEPVATSTAPSATTTAAAAPVTVVTSAALPPSFADAIVENRDARILKDAEGRTLMLYGFYDKETLILARNEAAFAELSRRLSLSRTR